MGNQIPYLRSIVPLSCFLFLFSGLTPTSGAEPYIKPPYDDKADGTMLINRAMEKAAKENKGVLISWGRNSCKSCVEFHRYFETHDATNTMLNRNYVRVSINTSNNRALMRRMNVRAPTVPYLTVLDSNGVKLTDHDPSSMFRNPASVYYFLEQYAALAKRGNSLTPAEQHLTDALKNLDPKKRLFITFGSNACDWCPPLHQLLANRTVRVILSKDFAFTDMNQSTLAGTIKLRRFLSGGRTDGMVPWFAIMDKQGNVLSTATGRSGTIGYPANAVGIAHFMGMIRNASKTISEPEFETLQKKLEAAAKEFGF